MYVLLIALVSNLATDVRPNIRGDIKHVRYANDIITYQVDYSSKERCLQGLKEMQKPSDYMKPVYLKCLPK